MTKFIKRFKKKSQGSLHVFLVQLFLLLFVVIIMTLAYNNYSILLMDNYADGALTDALLAAGTVNVEEYGASGQVLMSDTLRANRSDSAGNNQVTSFNTSTEIQQNYDTSSAILKTYLTDPNGFISWTYPEYRVADEDAVYDTTYRDRWVFATNYGYDIEMQDNPNPYVDRSDQNYNKINYMTLENNTSGGEYKYSWIDSASLDSAFLDFIKQLNNDNQTLGTTQADANNKQLAKSYENFLTTFGWDFGLKEVTDSGSVNAMSYNNFKYHGGRLGTLTQIADSTGVYQSPIYVDYITIFNVYKHYLTDGYGRFITYPDISKDGNGYYMKVGDQIYGFDPDDPYISYVEKLYKAAKKNGLNGLPIYDKMIITKTTLSRGTDSGDTSSVVRSYNQLSWNHAESSEPIIQSVDYLDPSIFIFSDFGSGSENNGYSGIVSINSRYQSYLDAVQNSTVTVFGSDTSDNTLYTVGVIQTGSNNYPWQQVFSEDITQTGVSRPTAKSYPNKTTKTYQLTYSGADANLANNKQNILLFNSAVMAQVEFDVQIMGSDGQTTGADDGVRTAFYQRIVDITISADSTAPDVAVQKIET